jgi:3',5'-cyclic-AMP phosphodiesterase
MLKKYYSKVTGIASFILAVLLSVCVLSAAEQGCYRIVVLGDPHLPGVHLEEKQLVRAAINAWKDVDLVVAVGDLTESMGNEEEYAAAKAYFREFNKPLALTGGNHDYIFADILSSSRKLVFGNERSRTAKLEMFRRAFGFEQVYYTKVVGKYLLVFLTPDDLWATTFATISKTQYEWLDTTLKSNRDKPTIIFFHAPLENTLDSYGAQINTSSYVAQPKKEIRSLLARNPQVFMWVSGHTHTSPKKKSFASAINLYDKRVINIHNTNMSRDHIYTNSLCLYPDRVEIRTYDHKKRRWLGELDRSVPASKLE